MCRAYIEEREREEGGGKWWESVKGRARKERGAGVGGLGPFIENYVVQQ